MSLKRSSDSAQVESSVWQALRRETQSNRESMCPLWFFHLLYIYIYIYWGLRVKIEDTEENTCFLVIVNP